VRIIFAGTPDFAASALEALIAAGHELVLVLTQPDRPAGRGMELQTSAVKKVALSKGIPVFQPEKLKDPSLPVPIRQACVEGGAELMVVAAYGLILPQAVLDLPNRGCLNIHASLLPRWRGAAPIHRAVEAGDAITGITIMQMDAGLDTGAMLLTKAIPTSGDDTTGCLHDKLAALGGQLIVSALAQLDLLKPTSQPTDGVTYANKISKTEAQLSWDQPAEVLARKIRAFNPFPGATLPLGSGTVKVWQVEATAASGRPGQVLSANRNELVIACQTGALKVLELQSPGGRRVTSTNWLNGNALTLG